MYINKTTLLPFIVSISLSFIHANEVPLGFISTTITGQNVFAGKWNNTNTGATLVFNKPNGSAATKYLIKIMFTSDADSNLYPDPDIYSEHNWNAAIIIGATNTVNVSGAAGMAGNSASSGDIETAYDPLWTDDASFEFVIVTYHGFSTIDDTIYSGDLYSIHEEDGPYNRGVTWTLSLTDGTDSGTWNDDNYTNINNISFDISGQFKMGDSVVVWTYNRPGDCYHCWDRSLVYYEAIPRASPVDTLLVSANSPLYMSGTDGSFYFILTVIDSNGSEHPDYSYASGYGAVNMSTYYDTIPPNAPDQPTLLSAYDTGFDNSDRLTSNTNPWVNVTSNQNPGYGSVILLENGNATGDSLYVGAPNTLDADIQISSNALTANGTDNVVYNVTAKLYDRHGNLSDASASSLDITIDTERPSTPGAPVLQSGSDTGTSNSDKKTNSITPVFDVPSAVVMGDSVYLIFSGVDTFGRGEVADGATSISLQASGFPISTGLDGSTYDVTVGAMDPAGNTPISNSDALSVTIDTTRPNAPDRPILDIDDDSGFSNSDNLTNETLPDFTVNNVRANETVRLSIGAITLVDSSGSGSPITFTHSSSLSEGTYTVTATSTDQAGNVSSSSNTLTLRIDTRGPDAPTGVDMLADDDTGESSQDNNTSNRQPQFTISGVTAGDSVYLKFDGDVKARNVATSESIELQPDTQIPAGSFDVTAVAVDSAGNISVPTGALNVTVDFTTSIPDSIYLKASSDKGRYNNDNITSDSTVVFVVTGVNAGDSVYVRFSGGIYSDGTIVGRKRVAVGQDSVDVTVTNAVSGTYSVNAYTTDLAGNTGGNSFTITDFTIDTEPPQAPSTPVLADTSDTGISTSDELTSKTKPTFTISGVSDADPDSVLLLFNSDIVAAGIVTTGTSLTLTPSADQPENTYSVTAIAIDLAGNLSNASSALTVRIDTTAPNPPLAPDLLAADDTGFDDSDNYTKKTQPSFILNGLSSTPDSVEIYFSGYSQPRKKAVISHINTDTLQINSSVTAGTYSVTVVAIDSAGNVSGSSPALTNLIIDVTPPATPDSIKLKDESDSGTDNSDNLTNDLTPIFTVYGVTANDSVYVVNVTDNDTVGRGKADNSSVDITISSVNQGNGAYVFKTYAEDPAGNNSSVSASASETVTIDATAPDVSGVTIDLQTSSDAGILTDDNLTNVTEPKFDIGNLTITDVNPDTVYLVIGTDTTARMAIDNNPSRTLTSFTLAHNPSGSTAKVFVRDKAGNMSAASNATITLRIDTQAPAKPNPPDLLSSNDLGFSDTDNITNTINTGNELNFILTGISTTSRDSIRFLMNNILQEALIVSHPLIDTLSTLGVSGGPYLISLVAIDSAGNISDTSDIMLPLLSVDNVPPATPTTPIITTSSDHGYSSSDYITNENQPVFTSSKLEAGAITTLSTINSSGDTTDVAVDTVALGETTILLTPLTPINDGTYSIFITTEDTAGNVTNSDNQLGVIIDTESPTAVISYSDSLVKENNVDTITVTFSEEMSILPKPNVSIDYTGDGNDIVTLDMINLNDTVWTQTVTIPPGNDGPATVSVIAEDLAGNPLTNSNTSNRSLMRVDNTPPTFSLLSPDSGAYVNHTLVGYKLSETSFSGTIKWTKVGGTIIDTLSPHNVTLSSTELDAATTFSDYTLTTAPTNLVSGVNYRITWSATDSAGNVSADFISEPVFYDTTAPTVDLTYSKYIASKDTVVTITAQFGERVLPIPQIAIDYTGVGDDVLATNMTMGSADSIIWTYDAIIPQGEINNGIASISITATDMAQNALRSGDVTYGDTLVVDNTVPTAVISYSDSLVKENNVDTITVTFSEEMSILPKPNVSIDYAGDGNDIVTLDMINLNDTVWTQTVTIPPGNDGPATVSVIAEDLAGNPLTNVNTSNRSLMRVDNTPPTFSQLSPDSGEYVNHTLVGYKLSETSLSGYVRWTQIGGLPDSNHTVALSTDELVETTTFSDHTLSNGPNNLVSGATYQMTWSATDSAGNTVTTVMDSVKYDTTAPAVALTYSKYIASKDTVVTITATFGEQVIPTPQIAINYAGVGDDVLATNMIMGSSSNIWTYDATIPPGEGNNGIVSVSITAIDMAQNALRSSDVAFGDTLVVDNTVPTITFSYENLAQPQLNNEGNFPDSIEVIAQFTEKANSVIAPVLNIQYADLTDDSFVNMSAFSSSNNDSVWIYRVILPDSVKNDGIFTATLTAKDLAGNPVSTFNNNQVFIVDNTPPVDFSTGAINPQGQNQVTGWYNSTTDSIEIIAPVPAPATDNTILGGGSMDIQVFNIVRGATWVTIDSQDSLTGSGSSVPFYRTKSEIDSVLVPGGSLFQGDTLIFRAAITDRVGNITYGDTSISRLVYDPFPPNLGQIIDGVFFTNDTNIVSSDLISASWSTFEDSVSLGNDGSGLSSYEYTIQHFDSSGIFVDSLAGWTPVIPAFPSQFNHSDLALQHQHQYAALVRAYDIAGNVSGIVSTDTIRRVNSAPVITAVTDTLQSFEDILFSQTIEFTDADTATLMGDNFTYKLTSTHQYGAVPVTPAVFLPDTNVINWEPTQSDTGLYTFQVIIQDNWNFADTVSYSLFVNAVNDTPTVNIEPPDDNQNMQEDQTGISKFELTDYGNDVDNDSTQLTWQVAVLDTSRKPGFPTSAALFFGDGTPEIVRQRLIDQYQFQSRYKVIKPLKESKGKSNEIRSVNSTNVRYKNSLANYIQVALTDTNGVWWAEFQVDSNYYGANHRIVFYVSDPDGATDQDTMLLTITPENDPPVIDSIPRFEVTENQFLKLDFADYVSDVDDTTLTVRVSALTYHNKMALAAPNVGVTTVGDSLQYLITDFGDTVIFTPEIEWSDTSLIQLSVIDGQSARASKTFVIDIIRVPRPNLSLEVIQNNAFTNFFEVVITDTISKTDSLFLTVQGQRIPLDTVAAYTYVGHYSFDNSGTYSFYAKAWGVVGDTTITRSVFMAQAKAHYDWTGFSPDGNFRVFGTSGAVPYDQGLLIVDSTMFNAHFNDRASYRLGKESKRFEIPVEVSFLSTNDIFAIYQRVNGVEWVELPSITKEGQIVAYTDGMGYFRLGPKTIIVPGETSLRQNYPNPFNPVTNIIYDVGFNEGPRQKVNVIVYNLLGQHVATLVNEYKNIGRYTIRWDGKDQHGVPVSSGIYFVRLMNDHGRIYTKKMMLIR